MDTGILARNQPLTSSPSQPCVFASLPLVFYSSVLTQIQSIHLHTCTNMLALKFLLPRCLVPALQTQTSSFLEIIHPVNQNVILVLCCYSVDVMVKLLLIR